MASVYVSGLQPSSFIWHLSGTLPWPPAQDVSTYSVGAEVFMSKVPGKNDTRGGSLYVGTAQGVTAWAFGPKETLHKFCDLGLIV